MPKEIFIRTVIPTVTAPPAPLSPAAAAGTAIPQIPAIVAPAVPAIPAGPREMSRVVIDVAALGSVPVNIPGDFVFVQEITWNGPSSLSQAPIIPLAIKPDTGPIQYLTRPLQMIRFPESFTQLQISNGTSSTATVTLTLIVGFGDWNEPIAHRVTPFFYERTITRPANVTPYAANQIVGTNPDLANTCLRFFKVFRAGSRYSRLTRAMIRKTSTTTANAQFSLYLFQLAPNGGADQAAFAMTMGLDNPAMGRIQFPTFVTGGAGSDMSFCDLAGLDIHLRQLDGNPYESAIYALLVADAAYVPTSGESLIVSLWGEQLG